MEPEDEITAAKDEALRRLGRNVVNFQKIKTCLKFLIAVSDVEGAPHELQAQQTREAATIRRQTMGVLADAFYKSVYGAVAERGPPPGNASVWISTSFRLEGDSETIKRHRRALSTLVSERNKLIHEDLSVFDHNSIRSCHALIEILDPQNVRILEHLAGLKQLIDTFKVHLAAIQSQLGDDNHPIRFGKQPNDA